MFAFIRVTLLAALFLSGCTTTPRMTDLEYDAPQVYYDPGNTEPLVAESIYRHPAVAPKLADLFQAYQEWDDGNRAAKELPHQCFNLPGIDDVEPRGSANYGPYARNVDVCLTVHSPINPERSRFVLESITIPGRGVFTCGSVFTYSRGERLKHHTERRAHIQTQRRILGTGTFMDSLYAQWGRVTPATWLLEPGEFENGNDDFLCFSQQGKVVKMAELIPLEVNMTRENLRYYAGFDPALQKAIEDTVKEEKAQTRTTQPGAFIQEPACLNARWLCNQPFTGPVMLHHTILLKPKPDGCYRVWALSVGRRLRTMDVRDPSYTQEIFARYIDCHGNVNTNVARNRPIG